MADDFVRLVVVDKSLWLPRPKVTVARLVYTFLDGGLLSTRDYAKYPWCVVTTEQTGWLRSKLKDNLAATRKWLSSIGVLDSQVVLPIMVDKRLAKAKEIIEDLSSEPFNDYYSDACVYLFGYGNIILLDNNICKSRDGYVGLCAIGTRGRGYFILGMPDDDDPVIQEVNTSLWPSVVLSAHGQSAVALFIDRNGRKTKYAFYRFGELGPVLASIPSAIRLLDSWVIDGKLVARVDSK